MPFIKDVANKKFNKKRIRAWNVLDVVDSSDLIQGNNQINDSCTKKDNDKANNLSNSEVNEQVNVKVNNKGNDQDDKVSFGQVKSRLKIIEIYYNSLQGAQKAILKKSYYCVITRGKQVFCNKKILNSLQFPFLRRTL